VRTSHRIAGTLAAIALGLLCLHRALWWSSQAGGESVGSATRPRHAMPAANGGGARAAGAGRSQPVSRALSTDPTAATSVRFAHQWRSAVGSAAGSDEDAAGATDVHASSSGAGAPVELMLLAVEEGAHPVLRDVVGIDLAPPRTLTLWQIDPATRRSAAVAHAQSAAGGAVVFSDVLLPDAGATLVIAARGASPFGFAASQPELAPALALPPPRARIWPAADGWGELEFQPIVGARDLQVEIAVRDARGRVLRREAATGEGVLRFAVPQPEPGEALWAAQWVGERRSPWVALPWTATDRETTR